MGPRDATLVKHALKGNRNAFGMLVDRYRGLVFGSILNKIRDFDAAEDLAQDTFVEAYLKLPNLREPSRFSSWLYGIASNMCLRWLSKVGRTVRIEPASEHHEARRSEVSSAMDRWMQDSETPESVYERQETIEAIWSALDALPEEYREVLVLYHLEKRSKKEIASFLDVSVGTVRGRLDRGRVALRRRLVDLNLLEHQLKHRKPDREFTRSVLAALPPLGAAAKFSIFWMLGWLEYTLLALTSLAVIGVSVWMLGIFESPEGNRHEGWTGAGFKVHRLDQVEPRSEAESRGERSEQFAPPAEAPHASNLARQLAATFDTMLSVDDAETPDASWVWLSEEDEKAAIAPPPSTASVDMPEAIPPGRLGIDIAITDAQLYVMEDIGGEDGFTIQGRPLLDIERHAVQDILQNGLVSRLSNTDALTHIHIAEFSRVQAAASGLRHLLRIAIQEPTLRDMERMLGDRGDSASTWGFVLAAALLDVRNGETVWTFRTGFHGALFQRPIPSRLVLQLGPTAWNRVLDHIARHVAGMVGRASRE